jgi:hypothetical protein
MTQIVHHIRLAGKLYNQRTGTEGSPFPYDEFVGTPPADATVIRSVEFDTPLYGPEITGLIPHITPDDYTNMYGGGPSDAAS